MWLPLSHTVRKTNYMPVSLTGICCKFLEHIFLCALQPQLVTILHTNYMASAKASPTLAICYSAP